MSRAASLASQISTLLTQEDELRVQAVDALWWLRLMEGELERADPGAGERTSVWGLNPVSGSALSEPVAAAWRDWLRAEARVDGLFLTMRETERRRRALESELDALDPSPSR